MTAQSAPARWTALRFIVILSGCVGLAFWLASLVWWWRIPASHRDGLELMGPVMATAMLIGLAFPALALAARARWAAGHGAPAITKGAKQSTI